MHILLDFDGTITQKDTIEPLGRAAVAEQQSREEQEDQGRRGGRASPDWPGRWAAIVDAYLADYKAHVAGYTPAASRRTTLAEELAFLRSTRDTVDLPSIYRVRDSGVFGGLTSEQLARAGRAAVKEGHVQLRAGFGTFLKDMATREDGWPVSIVSINWSDAWIRGAIEGVDGIESVQGVKDTSAENVAWKMADIRIYANEVNSSGDIRANFARRQGAEDTGGHAVPVASCSDKLEAMHVAMAEAREVPNHGKENQAVYIGDSTTDLECLLGATAGGIIISSGDPGSSSTLKTLARLNYHVPHVSEAPKFGSDQSVRLAWAADFDEILASGILDG